MIIPDEERIMLDNWLKEREALQPRRQMFEIPLHPAPKDTIDEEYKKPEFEYKIQPFKPSVTPNQPTPPGPPIEIQPSKPEWNRLKMDKELHAADKSFQPKFDKVRGAQGIWSLMKGKVYIGSLEDNGFSADVLHKEFGIPYSFWNADPNKSQSLDSWAAENRDKFGIYDEDVPMSNVAIEALKDYAMSRGESDPYKRAITIPEKEGIIDLLGELEGIKQEIRRKYGQEQGTRAVEQIQRNVETEVDNTESGQVIAGANKELSLNPEEIAAFANDLTPQDIDLIKQSIEQGLPETDIAAKAVRYLETQKKPAGIKEKTSEFATPKKEVLTIGDEVTVKGMEKPVKIENIRTETDLTGKQYKDYFTKEGWIPEAKIVRKLPPKTEAEALFKTEEAKPTDPAKQAYFDLGKDHALQGRPLRPPMVGREDYIKGYESVKPKEPTAEQAIEQMREQRKAEREVQRLPDEGEMFKEQKPIKEYVAGSGGTGGRITMGEGGVKPFIPGKKEPIKFSTTGGRNIGGLYQKQIGPELITKNLKFAGLFSIPTPMESGGTKCIKSYDNSTRNGTFP